jgi:hypothetical protein
VKGLGFRVTIKQDRAVTKRSPQDDPVSPATHGQSSACRGLWFRVWGFGFRV